MKVKRLIVVGIAGVLSACVSPASMAGFKHAGSGGLERAAYELDCPENQLELTYLGNGTVGAAGCGKKAIYVWMTNAGWVNNSAAKESKPAK
jgi:hypothetical protein